MDWKENDSDAMNFPFTDILSQDLSRTFYAFCGFFHISKAGRGCDQTLI